MTTEWLAMRMNPDLWHDCTSPRQMIDWLGDKADEKRLIIAANITRHLWDARTSAYDWSYQGENHVNWLRVINNSHERGRVVNDACNVLRCLFRNPLVERERVECPECKIRKINGHHDYNATLFVPCKRCECKRNCTTESLLIDPRWISSTVLDLAKVIRGELCKRCGGDGREPSDGLIAATKSCLDCRVHRGRHDLMPALADALQDAGCDDDEIIRHCLLGSETGNAASFHVDGCWIIEAVLDAINGR